MTTTPRIRPRPIHLAIAGAVLALTAACQDPSEVAVDDVSPVRSCTVEGDGVIRAVATVTNHSSKTSSYFVDIEFSVDGHEVDTRTATVEEVDPGEVVPAETTVRHAPRGDASCEVVGVSRFKA